MILQEIGGRCNSLWHIRNDCKLSETNARNSASAAAESEENAANSEESAANSEDMAKKYEESAKRSSDKASASARQQQSDWDVDDDSVTSYIKNKPVLGYYIDTKYGLTNDNFTEKISDF